MKNKNILLYLYVVLGVASIIFGILIYADVFDSSSFIAKLNMIVIALLLLGLIRYLMYPDYKKVGNKNAKLLIMIEMTVVAVGAVVGFILPVIGIVDNNTLGSGSLWVAIAFVVHGALHLYLGNKHLKVVKTLPFVLYILLIIAGVIVHERSLVESNIKLTLLIVLSMIGVYFLYLGFELNKKKKVINDEV